MTYTITIDYDQDADFSWLDQECFKDENPADHIALALALWENGDISRRGAPTCARSQARWLKPSRGSNPAATWTFCKP